MNKSYRQIFQWEKWVGLSSWNSLGGEHYLLPNMLSVPMGYYFDGRILWHDVTLNQKWVWISWIWGPCGSPSGCWEILLYSHLRFCGFNKVQNLTPSTCEVLGTYCSRPSTCLQWGARTCMQNKWLHQGIRGYWQPCYLVMSTWLSTGNSNLTCSKQTSSYSPAHWRLLGSSPPPGAASPLFQGSGQRPGHHTLLDSFSQTTHIQIISKSRWFSLPPTARMRPFLTASTSTVLAKPASLTGRKSLRE